MLVSAWDLSMLPATLANVMPEYEYVGGKVLPVLCLLMASRRLAWAIVPG